MQRIFGVALVLAVLAGACGDDGDQAQDVTPSPAATATTVREPSATQAPTTAPEPTSTVARQPTPTPEPERFFAVEDLAFDQAGVLWVTTGDRPGRLYRLVGDVWQLVEQPTEVFRAPTNWEVRGAADGGVYLGSGWDGPPSPDSGVYLTDGTNWELFGQEFTCGSLAVDTGGQLWATCPDFLTRLVDGRWVDVPEGWAAQSVAAGPDGSVWFTTFTTPGYELWRLNGEGWTNVAPCEDCVGPRSIIGVDAKGGAWVARGGCGLAGLTRFDPSGEAEEFDIRGARDVAFTADGAIWIALPCLDEALPAGVARYLDGEIRVYTTDDGLPDNDAQAVEIGPDGSLYAGTDHGVSRYVPDTDTWVVVGNGG